MSKSFVARIRSEGLSHRFRAQRFLAFTGSSQGIKAFCEFSEQIPFGHTRGFLDR